MGSFSGGSTGVTINSTQPISPNAGEIWVNNSINKMYYRNAANSAWIELTQAEYHTFTAAETFNPRQQTGLTKIFVDYTNQSGGKLDFKKDGTTVKTMQDSDTTKVYETIVNPSSSLSFVGGDKTFGFTNIVNEGTPTLSGGSGNSDLQLFWKPDGTVLYRFRRNSSTNYQAWLQQFTNNGDPFDPTASFTYNGETSATVTGMDYFNGGRWLGFNTDGTKIIGFNLEQGGFTKLIRSYNLSTAWDVTTMSTTENDNYNPTQGTANSQQWACMSSDGTKLYHGNYGTLYQYNLSTPFSLSSASYSGKSKGGFNISVPSAIYVNKEATEVYYHDNYSGGRLRIYYFGTAGDISTVDTTTGYTTYSNVGTGSSNAYGVNWDNGIHITYQGGNTFKNISSPLGGTITARIVN